MKIRNWKDVPVTEPMTGLTKRVAIGPEIGATNFIMRIFELKPGFASPYHDHPWEHEVYVLEGCGTALNEAGEKNTIQKGDVIFIPSNERHRIENTGTVPFQFICLVPKGGDQ
jgi:quercetin dioxygenase-like cupin family protein